VFNDHEGKTGIPMPHPNEGFGMSAFFASATVGPLCTSVYQNIKDSTEQNPVKKSD
jgi:hypothetical protein